MRLWDVESGVQIRVLQHLDWVLNVAFSPNGRLLASGTLDNLIQIWDVETFEIKRTIYAHKDIIAD
ncbi:hypothetical protein [Candidatus Albibeggiatoa sp. nov. BB20]|uniref:WD40 domain-containing protein n=1 Tax=Candidatus Albibeggiatoa sp. nov. BB20 TaxID=3162723 RepID=UPI0033654A29